MRKKFSIFNLQLTIKIVLVFLIFCILYFTFYSQAVTAIESTPSSDIKLKLKALQEEIASKAAQFKEEIKKKLQNKAFVGFVKSKSKNTLTLATKSGVKMVTTNDFTSFEGKGVKNLSHLKSDDFLAALGDVDDNDVLTAKKIVKLSPPSKTTTAVLFGKVVSVEENTVTIRQQTTTTAFLATRETIYKYGPNIEGTISSIQAGKPIIVVLEEQEKIKKARLIYIYPHGINPPKTIKEATSSPTPTPTKKPRK